MVLWSDRYQLAAVENPPFAFVSVPLMRTGIFCRRMAGCLPSVSSSCNAEHSAAPTALWNITRFDEHNDGLITVAAQTAALVSGRVHTLVASLSWLVQCHRPRRPVLICKGMPSRKVGFGVSAPDLYRGAYALDGTPWTDLIMHQELTNLLCHFVFPASPVTPLFQALPA